MELKLTGHNFEYELTQATNLFYRTEADVCIESELIKGEDADTVKTVIKDSERMESALCLISRPYDERTVKNAVKKSFYLAAKKLMPDRKTPWGIMTGIRPCKLTRELLRTCTATETDKLLSDEYLVQKEKRQLVLDVCRKQEPILEKNKEGDVGLYVGIPFCPTRCLYCSFISESAGRYIGLLDDYVDAVIKELYMLADCLKTLGKRVTTIYVGGGTPTTLSESLLKRLTDAVCTLFDTSSLLELTVEAGRPDTVTKEKLEILKRAGVTRLCINPQTMNDKTLRTIGRSHTAEQVIKAYALAKETGHTNINADLICGLPGETEEDFLYTLEQMQKLSPSGITVHTMYIKRASALFKELDAHTFSGRTENMLADMQAFAKGNGYEPYYLYRQRGTLGNLENVGYAKPQAFSYYNVFMMEEVQTIIGAGSGASTKMVAGGHIERVYNNKDPKWYIDSLSEMLVQKRKKLMDFFGEDGGHGTVK